MRKQDSDQDTIDNAAVDRFAEAMREKLSASRAKGRDGWQDPDLCPETRLADMLVCHLPKGNPGNFLDIATIAMMLHERGADPAILSDPLSRIEEQRPWRPISEAPKGNPDGEGPGPAIWAKLRDDLSAFTGREDLDRWNGIQVSVRHPGIYEDEDRIYDHGWGIAAPVGYGGIPDSWFAGWVPLRDCDVTAEPEFESCPEPEA